MKKERPGPGNQPFRWASRVAGAALLVLTLSPVYLVFRYSSAGMESGRGISRGPVELGATWWGFITVLLSAGLLTALLPTERVRAWVRPAVENFQRIPILPFAVGSALLAASLAAAANLLLFRSLPTLLDGMVTLLQARAYAAGTAAIPLPPGLTASWLIQNTVLTSRGWVSQYPPLPAILLAGGMRLGLAWLVWPVMVGATAFLTVLSAQMAFRSRPLIPRLGAVLLPLSPFLLLPGGGYLSHVPAAAFISLGIYATLRASHGTWTWGLITGAASGAAVACRPWTGLVLAVGLPTGIWIWKAWKDAGRPWLARRLAAAIAAGLPFAIGLGALNQWFFGHPLRSGYEAAFGPSHGLGFHTDPWGFPYGPLEALGFTGLDLTSLGLALFESPLPAVVLVGTLLLVGPPLRGLGLFLLWACLPLLANAFYWHHGVHLGPRMLYEAAPAWVVLVAAAVVVLGERRGRRPWWRTGEAKTRIRLPDLVLWAMVVSLAGQAVLVPQRLQGYAWSEETRARISLPPLPGPEKALVFVHGSWGERTSARLQAGGIRLDSVEAALRRNDICILHTFALATRTGTAEDPPLEIDFQKVPGRPPGLRDETLSDGNRVTVDPALTPSRDCLGEAASDRNGVISLAPLVWQGDLPGVPGGRPIIVRDLGWSENGAVLEAYPDRRPYVFLIAARGIRPELVDYEEGMMLLWGRSQAEGSRSPAEGGRSAAKGGR